ncbi:uncharacterized protein Z518_05461 [Rhinocladiella mackenziei CBS 650.93]|uniref:Uncharacterized protein n=1 Tax=Rhinocladiella mackenziei CBS 650.93 TaxID=1442369 RepID=A0A0D2IN89_9EURO|nr:uncharacterized protein Z518_05461 [Rhinocladiella mackenziei CBS 650.93]KIX04591.1 hypothetical protein Z518_05461 [Rhinocladiella mackenziei CBS 650.93]
MARSNILSSICRSCRRSYITRSRRFTSNSTSKGSQEPSRSLAKDLGIQVEPTIQNQPGALDQIAEALRKPQKQPSRPPPSLSSLASGDLRSIARNARDEAATRYSTGTSADEPYHLNVYAHRQNMHITFTEPSRNPILSLSVGNLGLRKAQRKTYDACFQLASYMFRKMAEKQWRVGGRKMTHNEMKTLTDIRKPGPVGGGNGIEIIFRGFGPGREAFQKALLGPEGRMIKPLISKVTDGTRLKFGGTRSPKVRRLG